MDGIKIEDCVAGHVYRIYSRNLRVGLFVPETGGFIGIRVKGHPKNMYLFTEYHRDNGPPFGTVCPLEDLGPLPDGIEVRERLGTICHNCKVAAEYDRTMPRTLEDGVSVPGTWVHLGPTNCADLRPEAVGNDALFRHLKEMEEGLGLTWSSVEEYEEADRQYLEELAEFEQEKARREKGDGG